MRLWGADHVGCNEGSHFHLEQDSTGRFKRMFCSIGLTNYIAFHAGINFSGVDSTFTKHYIFRQGQLMLLVTRDSNNQLLVLAWCTCLKENSANYRYFADHCKKAGLDIYLNRKEQLLYSDRHKGIPAFEAEFLCGTANCIRHIIDNCRAAIKRSGGGPNALRFHDNQVLEVMKAPTRFDYDKALGRLAQTSRMAAEYIDDLPHEKTFTYKLVEEGYCTHGHCTSNLVEIMNGVWRPLRELAPYQMNNGILEWFAGKLAERQNIAKDMIKKKAVYTPYAADYIAKQELLAREETMQIHPLGGNVFRVTRRVFQSGCWINTYHNVDVNLGTCDCARFLCYKLPCMHIILIVDKLGLRNSVKQMLEFREKYVPRYFHAESYIKAYVPDRTVIPPKLHHDECLPGITDAPDRVLPPPQPKRKLGRQQVARMTRQKRRSRGKFAADEYVDRKRAGRGASSAANSFVKASTSRFKKNKKGSTPLISFPHPLFLIRYSR